MVLALTLLVRDEIDLIEDMINYHFKQGVDIIIATDNGSTDGTLEVLKKFQNDKNLELILELPSDFSQHRWVSRMANIAFEKYGASWIINADADELFVLQKPKTNLKSFFQGIPENVSIVEVIRHDFIPFDRPKLSGPHIEMVYRKSFSCNTKGQKLPPKVVHRGSPMVKVSQGNHSVTGEYLSDPVITNELFVYHYPIRTFEQFYSKVRNGGSGYARNTELNLQSGFHKRTWYKNLLNGQLKEIYDRDLYFGTCRLKSGIEKKVIIQDRTVVDFFLTKLNCS